MTKETNKTVDWELDGWFVKYHKDKVTPEFETWWLEYYGEVQEYTAAVPADDPLFFASVITDYYIRAAFALTGWLAAQEHFTTPEPVEPEPET